MRIQKKHLQIVIMIIVVVIAMVIFSFWVKETINKKDITKNQNSTEKVDIDLTPRPIKELFASDFLDLKNNNHNQSSCDKDKILNEREKLISEKKIFVKENDKLTVNNSCLWTYEGDSYRFFLKSSDDSIFYTGMAPVELSIHKYKAGKERDSLFFIREKVNQDINEYFSNYSKSFFDNELTWLSFTGEKKFGIASSKLFKVRHYVNDHGVSIYRIYHEIYTNDNISSPGKFTKKNLIMFGYDDYTFPEVVTESNEVLKDFLDTIEPIKQ